MAFNSDRDGFLLPDERLNSDGLAQGIRGIKRNTDLILSLLRTRTRSLDRSRVANPNSRTQRPGGAPGGSRGPAPTPRQTSDRTSSPIPGGGRAGSTGGGVRERDSRGRFTRDPAAEVAGEVRQLTRQQAQQNAERERAEQAERSREGEDGGRNQTRDARGRFGSGGGAGGGAGGRGGNDEDKGLIGRLKEFFKDRSGGIGDADKVDPAVESAKEVAGMVGGAFSAMKGTFELGRAVTGRGFGGPRAEGDAQTPWFKRLLQQLKLMRRDDTQFHRAELRALNEPRTGGGGGSILTDLLKLIFSPLGAAIVAALTGIWMGFGDKIMGAWNSALDKITAIFAPIAKWFGDKFGIVTQTVASVGDAANTAIKDATGVDVKAGAQKVGEGVAAAKDWAAGKLKGVIGIKGTERDYERQDGTLERRSGGSASWRHNNPGNMKMPFKGSADPTDKATRSKEKALADARRRYGNEVIGLDQRGYVIFSTPEAGRAAQAKLLQKDHGNRTVEEMLPKYAISDHSGKANHAAYAAGIHKKAQEKGLDLRGKKIGDMTEAEVNVLLDGMKKVEGFKEGKTSFVPAPAGAAAIPAIASNSMPTATMAGAMPAPGIASSAPRIAAISIPAQTPPAPTPRTDTPIPLGSSGPVEVTVRNQDRLAGQDVKDRRLAHIATGGMSSA